MLGKDEKRMCGGSYDKTELMGVTISDKSPKNLHFKLLRGGVVIKNDYSKSG